jgi:hypothetical protein
MFAVIFHSKKKNMGAALFSYRFTILTHGQQKTRNIKEITLACHIKIFFFLSFQR